jgi:hypothetical protein
MTAFLCFILIFTPASVCVGWCLACRFHRFTPRDRETHIGNVRIVKISDDKFFQN